VIGFVGLKALDLSVMLYMTTGFNVRVSHPGGTVLCCDFAECDVVKYLFVYVWSYRVDKGPNAARKRAYYRFSMQWRGVNPR
jgi:hypothetical protein